MIAINEGFSHERKAWRRQTFPPFLLLHPMIEITPNFAKKEMGINQKNVRLVIFSRQLRGNLKGNKGTIFYRDKYKINLTRRRTFPTLNTISTETSSSPNCSLLSKVKRFPSNSRGNAKSMSRWSVLKAWSRSKWIRFRATRVWQYDVQCL